MTPNPIRQRWAGGGPAVNGWLSMSCPFAAEVMAEQGFDSLTVDLQHGVIDYAGAVGMFQAMRASGVAPMARVPWLDPGAVMKVLDAGAIGVICPMIDTAEQAARLAEAVRYPPAGRRSFGPTRAALSAGPHYFEGANAEVLALAMIETAEGVANLDAILATPGLDGVYVGPADLTLGVTQGRLGPGFDREEPEMVELIQRIAQAARAAGRRAGLHCGAPEYAAKAAGWGYDLVTMGTDARLLADAAALTVSRTRTLLDAGRGAEGN